MGWQVNWQAVTGTGACLTALFGALTAWGTWTRTWIAAKEYTRLRNEQDKVCNKEV
jgi:NAD(P)H-hydrate repair Nnr-like enzyme with NAD(P)H-hydrate dehydratase domain